MRRRGPESGAAALETALVLPVFLTLVIGIFNIGWALYCGAEVRHAVERSTRMIIANPDTAEEDIQTAVAGSLDAADPEDVAVTLTTEDVGDDGSVARLAWTYGYAIDAPFMDPIVLDFGSSIIVPLRG